jgi:hypothetical protein
MKKIKIDKIYRNVVKKDGSEYIDKRGKKFTYVTLYITGDDKKQYKLSHCDYDDWTASFSENQVVMLNVEKNGEYLNFSKPTKADMLEVLVLEQDKRITALEETTYKVPTKKDLHPEVEVPDEGPEECPEEILDLPFN